MTEAEARMAGYVATLGRGPGRSRALTRAEAADAAGLLLDGEAHPTQTGAFLMLLRYRGEDADEIAGLVDAIRARAAFEAPAALDWPSYGAGRTRGAPWYLLAALALAAAGTPVLMHGTNAFSSGMSVAAALASLGLAPAASPVDAARRLATDRFAYLPLDTLCPPLAGLLALRGLLGLRSPFNTAARLINPAAASASVDGVFHPPYLAAHLAAAERLGQHRLLVIKGGGGEAERNPARPVEAHLWIAGQGASSRLLAALTDAPHPDPEPPLASIWDGSLSHPAIEARIVATIALALLALGQGGDPEAASIWQQRPANRCAQTRNPLG